MFEDEKYIHDKIFDFKDQMTASAKSLLANLKAGSMNSVDNDRLDILNLLGKIGMLVSNPDAVAKYARSYNDIMSYAMHNPHAAPEKFKHDLAIHLIRELNATLVSSVFVIKKKNNKFIINMPNISMLISQITKLMSQSSS